VAALIDLAAVAVEAVPAIWTARLRTDRVAIFRASASKISNAAAAASGVTVVMEDLAGAIVLAVADSAPAVIASAAEHSVAVAALADSAAAEADDRKFGLGFASNFPYNQKLNQPTRNKTYEKTINTNKYRCYNRCNGADNSMSDDQYYIRQCQERGFTCAVWL
jgi:hypothetical protein